MQTRNRLICDDDRLLWAAKVGQQLRQLRRRSVPDEDRIGAVTEVDGDVSQCRFHVSCRTLAARATYYDVGEYPTPRAGIPKAISYVTV